MGQNTTGGDWLFEPHDAARPSTLNAPKSETGKAEAHSALEG